MLREMRELIADGCRVKTSSGKAALRCLGSSARIADWIRSEWIAPNWRAADLSMFGERVIPSWRMNVLTRISSVSSSRTTNPLSSSRRAASSTSLRSRSEVKRAHILGRLGSTPHELKSRCDSRRR